MLTHLGLEPREKAGSRRAGQTLSYSLRQGVRCGPHRDDLAGRVFGYATSAISERSLERQFLHTLLIRGELSKFNMKKGSG